MPDDNTRDDAERLTELRARRPLDWPGLDFLLAQIDARDAALRGAREQAVMNFAYAILHGDEKHRQWLVDAAAAFCLGNPLPSLAQPEPARETCGECDYDPTHLYHECSDNPGTKPEPARREGQGG